MHDHLLRKFWLAGWITVLFLAAGCFQPAGAGLEATNVAQSLPTFTPYPTDTQEPPPTDTPTEQLEQQSEFPTPTLEILVIGTQVADAGSQELDPFYQTATAAFLQGQGDIFQQPIDQPTEDIDPLLRQATELVRQATETAGAPLTQTAFRDLLPNRNAVPDLPTNADTVGPDPVRRGLLSIKCSREIANLFRISLKFGLPYMSIAQASRLVNPNIIHLWDTLIIPGCGTTGYQPPATLTPSPIYGGGVPPDSGGTAIVDNTLSSRTTRCMRCRSHGGRRSMRLLPVTAYRTST